MLRERAGRQRAYAFHVMGGSGCLQGAKGEILLVGRDRAQARLESKVAQACAPATVLDGGLWVPPMMRAADDPTGLPAFLRVSDGGLKL